MGDCARDRHRIRCPGARRHHRPRDQHFVLRPLLHRIRLARQQSPRLARFVYPADRRRDRRSDGAVRIESHSRPWHSRGNGAGPAEREPHSGASDIPQAAVRGDFHRHRRSVWRRGSDHRDRWRAGVGPRTNFQNHRDRAKNTARSRRRCRNGGNVRQSGVRSVTRGRASAVRVQTAIARPCRAGERRGVCRAHAARWNRADFRHADACTTERRSARDVRIGGGVDRLGIGLRHARCLLDRGSLRAFTGSLDVVAGDRRSFRWRDRHHLPAHARGRLRQHRRHGRWKDRRRSRDLVVHLQISLVVDLTRQRHFRRNAGATVHDWRRVRRCTRRAVCAQFSTFRNRPAHLRSRGHGGDVCRCVTRAARISRVRV